MQKRNTTFAYKGLTQQLAIMKYLINRRWRGLLVVLLSFLLIGGLWGCHGGQDKAADEGCEGSGYIVYKLHWHAAGAESVFNTIFPSELKLYFSKPHLRMEMASMGGIGKAVFLLNTLSGEGNVMVSIVGVRSRYHEVLADNEQSFLFSNKRAESVAAPIDTIYMGAPCLFTEASLSSAPNDHYRLIYNPNLGWKGINNFSPFEGIEGAVLCGSFCLGHISVEMEAKEVVPSCVDPKLFQVDADYKEVSRSTMEQLLGFGF